MAPKDLDLDDDSLTDDASSVSTSASDESDSTRKQSEDSSNVDPTPEISVSDSNKDIEVPSEPNLYKDTPDLSIQAAETQPGDVSYAAVFAFCFFLAVVIHRVMIRITRDQPAKPPLSAEELRQLRQARLATPKVEIQEKKDVLTTTTRETRPVPRSLARSASNSSEKSSILTADLPSVSERPQPTSIVKPRKLIGPQRVSQNPRVWSPVQTFEELLNWSTAKIPPTREAEPLMPRAVSAPKRLLIAHDMAGNYAEDSWVDGWFPPRKDTAKWVWGFRPAYLAWCDIFVYFTHTFVSPPPRPWVDACHRHGCRVLGTLITEWDAGEALCQALFGTSREVAELAAEKMFEMSSAMGFDGWLINIENKLSLGEVENCKFFLDKLSSLGTQGNKLVIWYDSVISPSGELRWQNGLNEFNQEFFTRANGGILTNYGWGEQRIQMSHETCARLGRSNAFVWHGIDVFGRGTLGGGGMACDVALNVIDRFKGSSACLFAPGWTLENACQRQAELGRIKTLLFFHKLFHDTAWGEVPPSILMDFSVKAMFTDFCDGGGAALWSEGKRIGHVPWLHLGRQRLQPSWDILTPDECDDAVAQRRITIRCVDTGPIYSGSCAIHIVGRRRGLTSEDWCFFPILSVTSRLGGTKGPSSKLRVKAAFLGVNGDGALGIQIASRDPTKPASRVMLVPMAMERDDCLPAVEERIVNGWVERTWELRTYDLRGRNVVGVSFTPLPMTTGSTAATWVDVRLGYISLDETSIDQSMCSPRSALLDSASHMLNWTCACDSPQTCCLDQVLVYVNKSFRQTAGGRGPCQVQGDLVFTPLGSLEDVLEVVACRSDGTLTETCRVQLMAESK